MASKTFFISDTHFNHPGVISFCNRPFADVNEMDGFMIDAWNAVVGRGDRVIHLGDFAFGDQQRAQGIFDLLNGEKVLVRGNHDKKKFLGLGWSSVHEILDLKLDGERIICCHYPMREWPGYYRRAWHLFGHSHTSMPSSSRALDVGVDNIGYSPMTFEELKAKMALLPDMEWRQGHAPAPKADPEASDDVAVKP